MAESSLTVTRPFLDVKRPRPRASTWYLVGSPMSDHQDVNPAPEGPPEAGPWAELVRPGEAAPAGAPPLPGWPAAGGAGAPEAPAWPQFKEPPAPAVPQPEAVMAEPAPPQTDPGAAPVKVDGPLPEPAQGPADLVALGEAQVQDPDPAAPMAPDDMGPDAAPDAGPWPGEGLASRVRAKRRQSPSRRLTWWLGMGLASVGVALATWKGLAWLTTARSLKDAGLGERLSVVVAGVDPTPVPTDDMAKETTYLADVVHLMHLDEAAGRAFVLTLPRDTRTTLAGVGEGAIGDALAMGGPAMVGESLSALTGLEAHHHIVLDMEAARAGIQELGPQEVYLPSASVIKDPNAKLDVKLPAGWLRLGANELLAYAYQRQDGAELERLSRQQAILHRYQVKLQSIFTSMWLGRAADRTLSVLRTDLSKRAFSGAVRAWAKLPPSSIAYAVLPGTVDRQGRYLISPTRWEGLKSRLLATPGKRSILEAKPTVEVVHQGEEAQAQALADRLSKLGFQVQRVVQGAVDPAETVVVDRSKADERSSVVLAALDAQTGGCRVVVDSDPAYTATYTLRLGAAFFKH